MPVGGSYGCTQPLEQVRLWWQPVPWIAVPERPLSTGQKGRVPLSKQGRVPVGGSHECAPLGFHMQQLMQSMHKLKPRILHNAAHSKLLLQLQAGFGAIYGSIGIDIMVNANHSVIPFPKTQ